jgi:hypothetical protein
VCTAHPSGTAQLTDILAWFRKTHRVLHACWNPCMHAMLHTLARVACSGRRRSGKLTMAIVMAMSDSVTVSMGELTMGVASLNFLVTCVLKSTCRQTFLTTRGMTVHGARSGWRSECLVSVRTTVWQW